MRFRSSIHLLSLVLVTFATVCGAHESKEPTFTKSEEHKPTPLPDRVVLTWSDDPTTTANVTWRTDLSTGQPMAEYVEAATLFGDLRKGIEHSSKVKGTSETFKSDLGECQISSAKLVDLKPDTMYAYRIGDGKHFSEWFQFRTASAGTKPFTFVYFGDAQNDVRSWWSRVVREANQHAPRAAFMLHAGDLINSSNRDSEWGEWFQAAGWLNGMIPVVATPGNHEYAGYVSKNLSRHWRPQFAFPTNGPSGLEETVYWFDYQGARVISLNSNEQIEEQAEWLKQLLEREDTPKWIIATFHHPIYSPGKDRDNEKLREAWQPVLEDFGVDLVLQGHDHTYARSGLGGPENVPEGIRRQESNTVYVVSVSGPKLYSLQGAWKVEREASGVQLFQVIHVSEESIQYEARLATGELYDAFTLKKNADGKSELIEQIPATEEIRK